MFMIMFSHFSFHGYIQLVGGYEVIRNPFNKSIISVMTTGNLGNIIFMIITGYFLCNSTSIKIQKLLSVIIQVLTYSLTCFFFYHFTHKSDSFCLRNLYEASTPLIHGTYWYFSAYVLIYLFHPFINKLILCLSNKEYNTLLITMFIVWGLIPSFLNLDFGKSNFLIFCMFYMLGAYYRLNSKMSLFNYYSWILVLCVFLWFVVGFSSYWVLPLTTSRLMRLYNIGSPLTIFLAISIFVFFQRSFVTANSKIINGIASCMGGVYLIHDNHYIRDIMYSELFHLDKYVESHYMLIYTTALVLLIFVVSVIVEWIRKELYKLAEELFCKCFIRERGI